MTFIGEDNSVLDVYGTCIHLYWAKEHGVRFRDISYDDSITIIENLWICGLKTCYIDAIDIYQIYTCRRYNYSNIKTLKQLRKDKIRLLSIENSLQNSRDVSNPVLIRARHYADSLRNSINLRQQTILRDVTLSV